MGLARQLLIVVLLCGLGVAAYRYGWPLIDPATGNAAAPGHRDGSAAGGGRSADRPATVLVQAVDTRVERARVRAVGTARAHRSVTLYPAAGGEVAAVHFAPDQMVRKGSVLLELDRRRERLAVDLARVRVENARETLSRYEQSAGSGAHAESTVNDARSALEEAVIALRQAQVALSDRQVVAPFDGFTGLTEIDVGDRIDTDDGITTLDDRASLLVGFSVPELFLGRVGKGHPVEVATWAARDRTISGEIVDLDSRIDPVSRSFIARARVANADDAVSPRHELRGHPRRARGAISPGAGDIRALRHGRGLRLGRSRGRRRAGARAHRRAPGGSGAGRRRARSGRAGGGRGHPAPAPGSPGARERACADLVTVFGSPS